MKSKTFAILVSVGVVLAAVAYWITRPETPSRRQAALGAKLIEELPVREIDRIRLRGAEGAVLLVRTEAGWMVRQQGDFPGDIAMISDLVEKVGRLTIGRRFSASEEVKNRLKLHPPGDPGAPAEHQGLQVRFESGAEPALVDLIVGAPREAGAGFGGQYVMPAGGPDVYLVDTTFKFVKPAPSEWRKKELIDVPADQVQRVTGYRAGASDPMYTVTRSEVGGAFGAASGIPLDPDTVSRLAGALSPLRIDDAVPATGPFESRYRIVYRLFDESEVTIDIAPPEENDSDDGPVAMRLRAEPVISGERAPLGNALSDLNRLSESWTYRISRWTSDNFVTDPAELAATAPESED